ncbi:MAG: hypothetical protein VKK04_07260 [Synechococcales bacterium]|nr:hypothetical protein [Synechococcales bacterium]
MSPHLRFVGLIVGCSVLQVVGLGTMAIAQFAASSAPVTHPPAAKASAALQGPVSSVHKLAGLTEFASDGGYVPPNNGGPDYSQGSGTR